MNRDGTGIGIEDPRLAAFALGELEGDERAAVAAAVAEDAELATRVDELRAVARRLERELAREPRPGLTDEQRERVAAAARRAPALRSRRWLRRVAALAAGLAAVALGGLGWQLHRGGEAGEVAFAYAIFGDDVGSGRAAPAFEAPAVDALRGLGYVGGDAKPEAADALRALGYTDDGETPSGGPHDTEQYAATPENPFVDVARDPLSTFAIDVDTASYSNVRRFLLREGRLPPPGSVRVEEMINYFTYADAPPAGNEPFAVHVEVAACPWAPGHRLVRIALKARAIADAASRPRNLVFLVDVSGSMSAPDKLPLLQRGLRLLVDNLDARDTVALAVYAGAAGLVLPPTSCEDKATLLAALDDLRAGGSTNGGEGLRLAYRTAREAFVRGGTNRVVLATDGDFNVGTTSEAALRELIEREAKSGVFLSVLGFGTGNLKDSAMEQLADRGNGNYAYVDSLHEARKVLVREMGATLETVAQDVKVQVELNPLEVGSWRLIGYENRLLRHQDFEDDAVDAGEVGAGHSVTALYEVVPAGARPVGGAPALRYQEQRALSPQAASGELGVVRLRWQPPGGGTSELLEIPVRDGGAGWEAASDDFRFAAAVAGFGMLLRGSSHAGELTYDGALALAESGAGPDPFGYRAELLRLVERARELARRER